VRDLLFAKSLSSYPKKPHKDDGEDRGNERLGDPICDCYSFDVLGGPAVSVAIADGCNWGPKPLEAAKIACLTFHESSRKNASKFTSIRETGRLLLKSFSEAHTAILQAPLKRGVIDIWETGTTTLLGGVLLQLDEEDARKHSPFIFICASVGDCKAFYISAADGSVSDITTGSRPPSAVTNVNDPGGRLGPYIGKEGSADLRNLGIFLIPCAKDDLILMLSDGVYDNFDPSQLGISTDEVGLSATSWEQADAQEAERAKDAYRTKFIADKLKEIFEAEDDEGGEVKEGGEKKGKKKRRKEAKVGLNDVSLEELAGVLLEHTMRVTKYSRKWMQEHPTARMPDARSKKRDPAMLGKMDHTTCIAIRVGQTAGD